MIITSKHIFDTESRSTFSGFIKIEENRITEVGPMSDLPEGEDVTDYGDGLIIPSFIDAHIHFFISVLLHNNKLTPVTGLSEDEVVSHVPDLPIVNGWKIGIGWYASEFGQHVYPTKASIDAICPNTPVVLISGDAHTIWLNSKAMEELSITEATLPKGVSGEAMTSDSGLTGVFTEAVAIHYLAKILDPLKSDFQNEFKSYATELNKMGVTAVGDLALTGEAEDDLVYPELYETVQSDTTVRIVFYPAMREDTSTIEDKAARYTSETLTFGGVKQFFDGVTSTHTAFMKDDYAFPYFEGDKGGPLIPEEKMRRFIFEANKKGWPMRIHTIGDQAIRLGLDYFKESEQSHPLEKGKYNALEHLEVMDATDLPLVNQDQLVISVQPSHLLVGWEALDAEVGPERAKEMFPFKDFLNEGATLGFGTDSPVVVGVTPLETLYYAVARKGVDGNPSKGLMPEQKLSVLEALVAHTKGSAMTLSRTDMGTLAPGQLADVCVLDNNILENDADNLLKTKVIATYFNGKLVYQNK